jgi:hypothetical protein
LERLVLEYADAIAATPVEAPDALFARLHAANKYQGGRNGTVERC